MPLVALAVLFIVVPLVELYVIIEVVGGWLGAPLTILLLCVDSLVGAALLRSQGRAVWRRFNEAMGEGRIPHREVLDGVLVIFGGAFLITPGFVTDIVGLVLLIPPTRALVRRTLARTLERRAVFRVAGAAGTAGRRRRERGAGAPGADYDVEGTAYEQPGGPSERDVPRLHG